MKILGIESSCDETAAAFVEKGQKVHSSVVASQIETHQLFGGVVPEIAAREHLKVIDQIVKRALTDAKMSLSDIDAIAITQGPGLIGALLVGISYAKGLAAASGLPLVPVNHVHAHVHGALLGVQDKAQECFPCLAMVVSGGHTNLYYMEDPTDFNLIAWSIDDACGESFDKVAKKLGLSYPGGPIVERMARSGDATRFAMPKMMVDDSKLLFSYSGLKTHMVNLSHRLREQLPDDGLVADLCAGFQEEALGHIVRKLQAAHQKYPKARSILIAGGVAANQRFKELMAENLSIEVLFPHLSYCSDNAAMIAALGYHNFKNASDQTSFSKNLNWDAFSRYQY